MDSGSIFNHSASPNVSYTRDPSTESIRFSACKSIDAGEELCIYYGHNLWFDPVCSSHSNSPQPPDEAPDDGWGGLSFIDIVDEEITLRPENGLLTYSEGDPEEFIPEEDLPYTRFRPAPEEETLDEIQTGLSKE